jgi:hypothetical protein
MNRPADLDQITSLPVDAEFRKECVSVANCAFDEAVRQLGYSSSAAGKLKSIWLKRGLDDYVDRFVLRRDMLPLDRSYALPLFERFIMHYLIDFLDGAADELDMS